MRILPVALAVSAIVHTGVAVGLELRNHAPSLTISSHPAAPASPAPSIDPAPIAVELIADARIDRRADVGAALRQSITTARRHGSEVAAATRPATSGTADHHASMMAMRQPEQPPIKDLGDGFMSHFLAVPSHAEPNPIEGERIEEGIETIQNNLNDPEWTRHASPDELRAAREALVAGYDARDAHELKRDGNGYKATHETWVAHVDADGNTHFEDQPNWQQHGLTGSFDATDAMMRHFGQDPYASQKRKFLDDTREERYEIGKRSKHERLAHSSRLAYQTLQWIWSRTRDVAERKQLVFELWDDCAESGDADLVQGGRDARQMIVGFIQTHLVGDAAYTSDELARLNAKKSSTATFAPYAP